MSIAQERATEPVLEILAINGHEWRVCDGRFAPTDARRVLGYIGRTGGAYELVCLQGQPRVESHDSLKSALDALIEPATELT